MQKVTRYKTLDGVLHDTPRAAQAHADKVYGLLLCSLAHESLRIEKYLAMQEFIEANLDRFLELNKLKQDRELQQDEDEDEDEDF